MAHNHLGLALAETGQIDEAIACYRQALALQPDLAVAHANLGDALRELREHEQAIAANRQALALDPNLPEAHINLPTKLLLLGEWQEGWREYESRWRREGVSAPAPARRSRRGTAKS